jgi:mRNA interferase MazF
VVAVEGESRLKRGEVWTVAGGTSYAGKPRPAVIVQDDIFAGMDSITICPLTRAELGLAPARFALAPSQQNGLLAPSEVMVDKITTVAKAKLGYRIGRLDEGDAVQLNRSLAIFLGLAGRA